MILPLVVLVGTAAAVSAGIYLTLRAFRATAVPAGGDAGPLAGSVHHTLSRHDPATTELLKRFFDGKDCAICKRAIPAVQRSGLKPGLMNPATHTTQSWDEIPDVDVAAALEHQVPVCPSCQVAESFRQKFPDLVVDRDRTPHDTHAHDRVGAGS